MGPFKLGQWGVVLAVSSFKLLQFCDRGIINGSPLEFSSFVRRTMTGSTRDATLFGALSRCFHLHEAMCLDGMFDPALNPCSVFTLLAPLPAACWRRSYFFDVPLINCLASPS